MANALPGLVVRGDRRHHRDAPADAARPTEPTVTRHDEAVRQVRALVPVLRATVEELDHHVQARHEAAADFRRTQGSNREG